MTIPVVKYKIGAVDDTRRAITSVKANFGGLKTVIGGISAAFAAVQFTQFITGAIDAADKLDKLTSKIGADVEDFQRLGQVAELSGVNLDTLGTALQRQTRRLSEAAKGSGEAAGALEELGLNTQRLATLDPTQQFIHLAQALDQVSTHGDRVRLAMRFWDTEGVTLVNLIDEVGDAYFDLEDATDKTAVKTEEQIKQAVRAKDEWTKLKTTLTGLGEALVLELAEPLADFIKYLRDSIPVVKEFFNTLIDSSARLRENNAFIEISDVVFKLYDKLVALRDLIWSTIGASASFIGDSSAGIDFGTGGGTVSSTAVPAGLGGPVTFENPIFTGTPNGALE